MLRYPAGVLRHRRGSAVRIDPGCVVSHRGARCCWCRRRRCNFALGAITALVGFSIAITAVSILRANDAGTHSGPMGKIGLDDLASPGGWLAGLGAASTFLGLVTLAIPESGEHSASTENVDRPLCKSSRVGVRRSAVLPGWVVGGWLLASKVLLRSLDPSRPRGSLTSESPVLHACKSTRRSVAALARRRP